MNMESETEMGLEKFISSYQQYSEGFLGKVITADDLREFVKGKVLVDLKDLLFIEAQIVLGIQNIRPPCGVSPFVALRIALQAVEQLRLQPNTGAQADE